MTLEKIKARCMESKDTVVDVVQTLSKTTLITSAIIFPLGSLFVFASSVGIVRSVQNRLLFSAYLSVLMFVSMLILMKMFAEFIWDEYQNPI